MAAVQVLSIILEILKHEMGHCSHTAKKTDSLRPASCDVPSDSLVIDSGYSYPYHPCRVTLTQTILDRIHQASVARMSHTYCEGQPLMHRCLSPVFGSEPLALFIAVFNPLIQVVL